MDEQFKQISFLTSKMVTQYYSTSFSFGVRCFHPSIQNAIYSIYGFVRFADEIVDTFHDYNKAYLLSNFEKDYYTALEQGISLNPILNAFQYTVKQYQIDDDLIQAFLKSMKCDLHQSQFDNSQIDEYIYGSAEVVGLMCLKVFVKGDCKLYNELAPHAKRLGAAFQKVNFLRDLQHDTQKLNRTYFPVLRNNLFDNETKQLILDDINADYAEALIGIKRLPSESQLGVYTAYLYYRKLTNKIAQTTTKQMMHQRIRIPNGIKILLLCKAYLVTKLNLKW